MPTAKPRQDASGEDDQQKGAIDQLNPIPDEDGPHDVPDDTVIEKTLPSSKPEGTGGSAG